MNFRLIAIMAAAALTVSATTGADAAKRRSAAKKKTTACAAGYPHFYLQQAVIKNFLTPKSFSLNGPVKTLRTINPIYDGQYQERTGAICNYTFDTDGKPLNICNDPYGTCAGWDRYYITYDTDGNFESIKVDVMEPTQDTYGIGDQSIKANYTFDYAGDKITRITEQTTSVWGKAVNWKPFHYTVVYTTDGRIKQVSCEEDPRVSFTFDNNNQLVGKRYANYLNFNPRTQKCSPAWELGTFEALDYSNFEEEDTHATTVINDHYRNWIQRSWKYEGSTEEWGEFREITYYE